MAPMTFDFLFQKSEYILCSRNPIWIKKEYESKVLYSDTFDKDLSSVKILFLYSCEPDEWLPFLPPSLKLLIIAGTDISYVNSNLKPLFSRLPTTHFWVTNWLGNHPRCTLLPLFPNFSVDYKEFQVEKKNLFGIPFSRINSPARVEFYKEVMELSAVYPYFMKELSNDIYQKALSSLFFCCCPMGNGFDTYRFWESLYFGAIPIVKNHPFYDALLYEYPTIPMILIEEWKNLPRWIEELSLEQYHTKWERFNSEILTITYWEIKLHTMLT